MRFLWTYEVLIYICIAEEIEEIRRTTISLTRAEINPPISHLPTQGYFLEVN